jgi:hypothetical protein
MCYLTLSSHCLLLWIPILIYLHDIIYCSGYHAGSVQADDDYNNHGLIDQAKHPCKSMAEFCVGYSEGYEDEAVFYAQ